MEHQLGTSDFGIDYAKLIASPKTPRAKTSIKRRNTPDRFIPNRSAMDMEISSFNLMKENTNPNTNEGLLDTPSKENYKAKIAQSLFQESASQLGKDAKVLAFKAKAPVPKESDNIHKVLYSSNKVGSSAAKPASVRHIPKTSERTLDAPGLSGDYYLNLIDWSRNDTVAVALGNTLYMWNCATGEITELMKTSVENHEITSVSWTKEGSHIAVGISSGVVELWDAQKQSAVRKMEGHSARVGALAWNNYTLSSGSKDTTIHQHDVRIRHHLVHSLENHSAEICGLKWSDDGLQLASGGNDNVVSIWDVNQTTAKFTLTDHTAAVKALAWCPWQKDLLATGGGSNDRTIRFWNTQTGSCLNSIDTHSQVSSIVWSPNSKELVSGHGYAQNELCVWKYPSLLKIAELKGHSDRVLGMCLGPDGKTVVSSSADETLRFWKIFEVEAKVATKKEASSGSSITRPISLR